MGALIGFLNRNNSPFNNNCNLGNMSFEESHYAAGLFCTTDTGPKYNNNCNSGTVKYGAFGYLETNATAQTAANNYCLSSVQTALHTLTKGKSNGWDPATITEDMVKSFSLDEVDVVIESLNAWAQANSTDTIQYAGWTKNSNGLPELDLGDLDTLANTL